MKADYDSCLINLVSGQIPEFDVLIVGAGMGGGTCAYKLCQQGMKVLLLEKGHSFLKETRLAGVEVQKDNPEQRLQQGQWPAPVVGRVDGVKSEFFAPLGCGLGGSTLLYGGALERFSPIDFEPRVLPDGSHLAWPYPYRDIEAYYQEAERLYNVHGSPDPLDKDSHYELKHPPPLNATDQYFHELFSESGLHPYHLHVALEGSVNTRNREGVVGSLESCISPALETGNLRIAVDCEVLKIEASSEQVTAVIVQQGETRLTLPIKKEKVVLACGAYFTPILLLKSANTAWPDGLANQSGLVGRNLMFHVSDFIGIWSTRRYSESGADKTLGLRDFYHVEGEKLGQLQSTGKSAEMGYILYYLRMKLATSFWGRIPVLNKILRQLLRVPAMLASLLFREASIFASIVEDHPYADNRVWLDPDRPFTINFEYIIRPELGNRNTKFRKLLKSKLKTRWVWFFSEGVSLNFGHPCGTCRAGIDPSESVLDGYGKAHDLANLYIADASFMPTSGGTNPSLTVAAHALRVADAMARELNRGS